MAKFGIRNLVPGKKYKMVIQANGVESNMDSFSAVDIVIPPAPRHASKYKLKIVQGSYRIKPAGSTKFVKKPKLTLTIPDDIYNNLMWTDTVRDAVHIVYRTAANKKNTKGKIEKYLDNNSVNFQYSSVPALKTTGVWADFHPKATSIKVKDNNYYSFQFVIARYIKDSSGNWSNKFWLQGNTEYEILSQEAVWGS